MFCHRSTLFVCFEKFCCSGIKATVVRPYTGEVFFMSGRMEGEYAYRAFKSHPLSFFSGHSGRFIVWYTTKEAAMPKHSGAFHQRQQPKLEVPRPSIRGTRSMAWPLKNHPPQSSVHSTASGFFPTLTPWLMALWLHVCRAQENSTSPSARVLSATSEASAASAAATRFSGCLRVDGGRLGPVQPPPLAGRRVGGGRGSGSSPGESYATRRTGGRICGRTSTGPAAEVICFVAFVNRKTADGTRGRENRCWSCCYAVGWWLCVRDSQGWRSNLWGGVLLFCALRRSA